jgi:tetratricopeptide (TPR) repeat protein
MAPSVSAIPPGGTFEGSVTVILSASDDTDPAPVIRYTLDGATPDARARIYDGPLRVEKTATLRYAALDAAGNVSATRSETYTIGVAEKYREERQWIAQGQYARALASLEAALARESGDAQARELLVSTSLSHARDLGGEGRWADAQAVLERAAAVAPGDPGVQAKLREAERRVGVEQIYQNGVRAAQVGEPEKAYSAFQKALELDPGHGPAKEGLAQVKRDAVEVHSKRALAAFRRQELDVAISEWDQALAIDPDNELAKLRRAEAVDLKARFEQLQQKGAQ